MRLFLLRRDRARLYNLTDDRHELLDLSRSQPDVLTSLLASLEAIARDWDMLGYYLPFGWPLLSLTRAWRRPPCGYRGLDKTERRDREGRFVWHLAQRPLPPPGSDSL